MIDGSVRRSSKASFLDSPALCRTVIQCSPDCIEVLSLDGRLEFMNDSGRRQMEVEDFGPLAGVEWASLWPEEERPKVLAAIAQARTGSAAHFQGHCPTARGVPKWWDVAVSLVADEGEGGHLVSVSREISEGRLTAEREAQTELFENAFRYAAIGKALVSLDGRFLKINAAFCELLGYAERQMLDMDFQTITHPDDLQTDLDLLHRLLAGEIRSYQMEKRYRRSDGTIVWVRLSVSMVRDRDGRPKHFISQVQDLTAAQEAQSRYRLMAENVTDVILTTTRSGVITFITPSCRRITGYAAEELVGRVPNEFAHPEDLPAIQRVFGNLAKVANAGEPLRWRFKHKSEDRWVWVESNPTHLTAESTGGKPMLLDVLRDVTEQVEQEQALGRATLAAEAAATAKSEFLANMSHEIRTPLTAIIGFSARVAQSTSLDDDAREQIGRVSTAGQALLSIVNDVLDFSKLEAGRFEIKPLAAQPTALADDAMSMFGGQAEAKGLQLTLQKDGVIPAWVKLDPDRLRQILLNLIGNAIKFTEHGQVLVRVWYDPSAERLHLSVDDTGPGLTQTEQAKLFQRFSQVDTSTTRRHGGTGLGLAICKGLAEAMGGQIGVASEPGLGSRFYFSVLAPVTDEPGQTREAGEPSASLAGIRLLVVDDNAINRELVSIALEPLGVEVTQAESGEAGVRAAAETPFDLILMDIRMPGMSGPAALRLIRERSGPNQSVPIVAFSADAEMQHYIEEGGFDDVVRKPIELPAMICTVATWGRASASVERALLKNRMT